MFSSLYRTDSLVILVKRYLDAGTVVFIRSGTGEDDFTLVKNRLGSISWSEDKRMFYEAPSFQGLYVHAPTMKLSKRWSSGMLLDTQIMSIQYPTVGDVKILLLPGHQPVGCLH